jgi:hypothetical protein
MRSRPTGILHLARNLPPDASLAEILGASLKTSAEVSPPCVCGAWPEHFVVESWDPEDPQVRYLPDGPQDGEMAYGVYVHRNDCPVLIAAEREEALMRAAFTPSSEGGTDAPS